MSDEPAIGARKRDHLEISLDGDRAASGRGNGLERYALVHEALPDVDYDAIDLTTSFLGHDLSLPLIISSMTGGTDAATSVNRQSIPRRLPTVQLCAKLGITRSHNRPRVSNDNPYSESQFATAKQHPGFPGKFDGLISALAWGREFFPWYNEEHHHSGLAYLTPAQAHRGSFEEVLVLRQQALDDAYARNPERFVKGRPRMARPPQAVWINRPKCEEQAQAIVAELGIEPAREEVVAQ